MGLLVLIPTELGFQVRYVISKVSLSIENLWNDLGVKEEVEEKPALACIGFALLHSKVNFLFD